MSAELIIARGDLARPAPPAPATTTTTTPADVVRLFLAGQKPTTLRAYRQALEDFATWGGFESPEDACRAMVTGGHGLANVMAMEYRAAMAERGLSSATVALRLSAIRAMVKIARLAGIVEWSLDVPLPRVKSYRDTRGPGVASVAGMIGGASARTDAKGLRDVAILRLLFDVALRREEVASLDLEHFNADAGRLSIAGKGAGAGERESVTLPTATTGAVRDWIAARGSEPGPLFVGLGRGAKAMQRLTGHSIARNVVKPAGMAVGVEARPHGLRHSAITAALDATGGDVRSVAKFSRHSKIETVCRYDDNRHDVAGSVAAMVAAAVPVVPAVNKDATQ